MILILDNYDSFTYNLYQLVGKYTQDITVLRNDKTTIEEIRKLNPTHIIISPGPGNPTNPDDFGICDVILDEFKTTPILGVCLGHQGIYAHYNGEIIKTKPVHGKKDTIKHNKKSPLFKNIPEEFIITRYHSLTCNNNQIPSELKVTSTNDDNIIMAIEHIKYPTYGIQFHPESIGSEYGDKLIENFLNIKQMEG